MTVRGVLHVHSAPPALCPHIEWAVAGVLGVPVDLPWADQPASPGTLRAELDWEGRPGAAGAITSALAGWSRLRFEVTEEASPGCDAVRFSYTPTLGAFSAVTSANGDILIPEGRLRAVMTIAAASLTERAAGTGSASPVITGPGDAAMAGAVYPARGAAVAGEAVGFGPVNYGAEVPGPRGERSVDQGPGDQGAGGRERHGPRHPALGGSLEAELRTLLGQPWDDELEPFRHAGAGAPVRWLHATG